MGGSKPSGEAVSKCEVEADYKGLLSEETARDLRIRLHAGLRLSYTKAQIEQITGWSGRTIRRDLQDNPEAKPIARRLPPNEPRETAKTKPGGLTQREILELKHEYGYSPSILNFLEGVEKSRATA